jgi:hypothetical protein
MTQSLPNPSPSFFSLETLQKLGRFAREPVGIAVFASLGFHGLLAATFPLMTRSSAPAEPDQRPVNVVELSPLERARLPQTNLSPGLSPGLSPFPQTSQPKSTDPLATLSPGAPLPSPTDVLPSYSIPGLNPYATAPAFEEAPPKPKPKPENSNPAKQAAKSEAGESPTESTSEDEKAAPGKADDLKGTTAKGQTEADKLAALFAFNAEGTSEAAIMANANAASLAIADQFPVENLEKKVTVSAPYPAAACQFQHNEKPIQGAAMFLVVTQNGKVLDQKLFGSSGFGGLNQAAIEFITKTWKPEENDKVKAYPVVVTMQPQESDCQAATKPGDDKTSEPTDGKPGDAAKPNPSS